MQILFNWEHGDSTSLRTSAEVCEKALTRTAGSSVSSAALAMASFILFTNLDRPFVSACAKNKIAA